MVKEKKENKGFVECQVFGFTNKIQRKLNSHLESRKKFFGKRSTKTCGKISSFASLFGK